jgi:hypothetical protein
MAIFVTNITTFITLIVCLFLFENKKHYELILNSINKNHKMLIKIMLSFQKVRI